jgi:hypothetical protein
VGACSRCTPAHHRVRWFPHPRGAAFDSEGLSVGPSRPGVTWERAVALSVLLSRQRGSRGGTHAGSVSRAANAFAEPEQQLSSRERHRSSPSEAYTMMRRSAVGSGRPLAEVAAEEVAPTQGPLPGQEPGPHG